VGVTGNTRSSSPSSQPPATFDSRDSFFAHPPANLFFSEGKFTTNSNIIFQVSIEPVGLSGISFIREGSSKGKSSGAATHTKDLPSASTWGNDCWPKIGDAHGNGWWKDAWLNHHEACTVHPSIYVYTSTWQSRSKEERQGGVGDGGKETGDNNGRHEEEDGAAMCWDAY